MRLLKDTRGNRSWTLTMVLPTWIILNLKLLMGGITVGTIVLAPLDLLGMSALFTATVAPWLAREWMEKKDDGSTNQPPVPPAG